MRLLTATVAFLGAGLLLAGCQMGPQSATPSASSVASKSSTTTSTPTTSPSATVEPIPALIPDGTATQNLPYFNYVIRQALTADPTLDSFAIAQIVSQSGFPADTVQFTFTRTSVGLAADSVTIAALFSGECLIGQYGPAVPEYHGIVLPGLAQGGCLIGSQVQRL